MSTRDEDFEAAMTAYKATHFGTAFNTWGRLALQGDPESMAWIGFMFEHGQGVETNLQQAHRWYAKASALGNASGAFNLGHLLLAGHGVERDEHAAHDAFLIAAEQGHARAQFMLSRMFAGHGFEIDAGKQIHWLQRAASQRDIDATAELARLHANGFNVSRDDAEAARLALIAAQGGHADAQQLLGDLYASGRGVEQSPQWALHWYERAASTGLLSAGESAAFARKRLYGTRPIEFVEELLRLHSMLAATQLLRYPGAVFWIVYSGYADHAVSACEEILGTGRLSAKYSEQEVDEVRMTCRLDITFGSRVVTVQSGPSEYATNELLEPAVVALADLLCPEYELRYCLDTPDFEDPTFLPLRRTEWERLESQYGPAVAKHFAPVQTWWRGRTPKTNP